MDSIRGLNIFPNVGDFDVMKVSKSETIKNIDNITNVSDTKHTVVVTADNNDFLLFSILSLFVILED